MVLVRIVWACRVKTINLLQCNHPVALLYKNGENEKKKFINIFYIITVVYTIFFL